MMARLATVVAKLATIASAKPTADATPVSPNAIEPKYPATICNGLWEYQPDFTKDVWKRGAATVEGIRANDGMLTAEAGKTGTVDDYTDAWFIGFDPNITVGVWIGYDEKKPIGHNETGAAAALPIWMDFMRAYIDARGDRTNPPQFEAPGNIVFVTLDSGVSEAFINGTQPAAASAPQ